MKLLSYWINQGEDRCYTIVETLKYPSAGLHPLTHFTHDSFQVPVSAFSVKELKEKLKAMLKACDEPMIQLVPEKIIQAQIKDV